MGKKKDRGSASASNQQPPMPTPYTGPFSCPPDEAMVREEVRVPIPTFVGDSWEAENRAAPSGAPALRQNDLIRIGGVALGV